MAGPLVRITCPHCAISERMEISLPLRGWKDSTRSQPDSNINQALIIATATVCPNCQMPLCVVFHMVNSFPFAIYGVAGGGPNAVDAVVRDLVFYTVPQGTQTQGFPHLPGVIAENFTFVQQDAAQRRNPAGIMSQARACLDVALKALGEENGGRRARIESLASRGIITGAIAAWAQNLWEEGSDAVHDLSATIDRAVEHVEFLKLFFEVAFELPARISMQPHAPVAEAQEQ